MAVRCAFPFALAFLLAPLGGCQKRSTALNPVVGKVSYRGMQLQSGIIVFSPDVSRGESGPLCVGKIREDGTFAVTTAEGQGAPSGWYRVAVATVTPPNHDPQRPTYPLVLPERYRDPDLSLLTCEIKAERNNQLDFNLD